MVGYLPSSKSIYVVHRGTTTTKNWIDDLDIIKKAYAIYPECNCTVHKGFYDSMLSTIDRVVMEVNKLRKQFPNYAVKIT